MPPSVSVGIGELSSTPAVPSTETWVRVIGNPNFSKAGNSKASAWSPPSRTSVVLVIEKSLRMVSSFRLSWPPLGKGAALAKRLLRCRKSTCGSKRDKNVKSLAVGALLALSAQARPIW